MAKLKSPEPGEKMPIMSYREGGDDVDSAIKKIHSNTGMPLTEMVRKGILELSKNYPEKKQDKKRVARHG